MENATFDTIRDAIADADKIVVISHDRPDGDAIGSTLALGIYLRNLGKQVVTLNADLVPAALTLLPGSEFIQQPGPPIETDLLISVDAAGKNRISETVWDSVEGYRQVVNIDHHISNNHFADINYVDPQSPATGEIIFQLIEHISGQSVITAEIADNLYAAISTDTGSFRYPNTTSKTYRIAASLIDAGANVGRLNQDLYESYPRRRVELLSELLKNMRFHFSDRCASLQLPLEAIERLGIQSGDTEGLIDVIRSIESVIVAVFFEEMPDGKIRVSSRSKAPSVDVGKICGSFGGGGHTLAAGTRLAGPMPEATERFITAVGEALK